jgi:hypothetical protein
MHSGKENVFSHFVSALQAFWPTVQVLLGDVAAAEKTFNVRRDGARSSQADIAPQALLSIWHKYGALPELYDVARGSLIHYGRDYPLRPEMVESAYYLYVATREPKYLRFAQDVVRILQQRCRFASLQVYVHEGCVSDRSVLCVGRVQCGFASIADVETHRLDDRMDSFFLSETLKYLFLLFDEVCARCAAAGTYPYPAGTSSLRPSVDLLPR